MAIKSQQEIDAENRYHEQRRREKEAHDRHAAPGNGSGTGGSQGVPDRNGQGQDNMLPHGGDQ